MLMKICQRCGKKIQQGQECVCVKSRYAAYDRDSRDKTKAAFYDSLAWRALADAVRARAGGCDELVLYRDNRLIPGRIVHHIYTIDERPDLKLDIDNLICLSADSHNKVHAAYDADSVRKKEMQDYLVAVRKGAGEGQKSFV